MSQTKYNHRPPIFGEITLSEAQSGSTTFRLIIEKNTSLWS